MKVLLPGLPATTDVIVHPDGIHVGLGLLACQDTWATFLVSRLDDIAPWPLPGSSTRGAEMPIWSRDGKRLAFVRRPMSGTESTLVCADSPSPITGTTAQTAPEAPVPPAGALIVTRHVPIRGDPSIELSGSLDPSVWRFAPDGSARELMARRAVGGTASPGGRYAAWVEPGYWEKRERFGLFLSGGKREEPLKIVDGEGDWSDISRAWFSASGREFVFSFSGELIIGDSETGGIRRPDGKRPGTLGKGEREYADLALAWSPDERFILAAYAVKEGITAECVCVQDGARRSLPQGLWDPIWDADSLSVIGVMRSQRPAEESESPPPISNVLVRIDAAGAIHPMLEPPAKSSDPSVVYRQPAWIESGKRLAVLEARLPSQDDRKHMGEGTQDFVRNTPVAMAVSVHDLAAKSRKVVFEAPYILEMTVSPDGRQIAVVAAPVPAQVMVMDSGAECYARLCVIELSDGKIRTLDNRFPIVGYASFAWQFLPCGGDAYWRLLSWK